MIKILYSLNANWSYGIAVFSIIVSLILAVCSDKKKNRIIVAVVCSVILVAITANYYFMMNYIDFPFYEGCKYSDVKISLSEMKLKNIKVVVPGGSEISDNCIVESCNHSGDIVNINDEIIFNLRYINSIDNSTAIVNNNSFCDRILIKDSVGNDLFSVTSVKSFENGEFYYENKFENYFVEFEQGISGIFSYNRLLTEVELDNWGHGGKILDSNGNECYFAECSFFSTDDGTFAVKLPRYIKSGEYTYVLYQFINGEYYEVSIDFEIS